MRSIKIGLGFTTLLILMVCFTAYEKQTNRTLAADLNQKLVATINGDSITEEDLEFYKLINRIQIAMNREADGKHLQGNELAESMKFWDNQEKATLDRNTLLTQIIRLRAVALLAKEKGYKATETEVKEEMEAVKQIYDNQPAALKMMKEYGEDRFWKKERKQYQLIVLSKKVQQDVINKVKKENPKAEEKEVNLLANKEYEELLISQIGTLKISLAK